MNIDGITHPLYLQKYVMLSHLTSVCGTYSQVKGVIHMATYRLFNDTVLAHLNGEPELLPGGVPLPRGEQPVGPPPSPPLLRGS